MRTVWKDGLVSIWAGDQHISRLTMEEVRELVCQILVFSPKALRSDLRTWIQDENVEKVASYLGDKTSDVNVQSGAANEPR